MIPREEKLGELLTDPRRTFGADGRYAPWRSRPPGAEIRIASAAVGYCSQMLTPESLGGGGGGARHAPLAAFEELFRFGGMRHWLAFDAVAHWATGPSHIFGQASETVLAEAWPGIISGEKTICFAYCIRARGGFGYLADVHDRSSGWRRVRDQRDPNSGSPTARMPTTR